MMIDPPIDKMIEIAPCRYALVVGIAKRAKELMSMEASELEKTNMKAISYAAKEVYEGKIRIKVKP